MLLLFISSFPPCRFNVPFLHLQLSQNSFFLFCNRSIFFILTCQRRPSLSNRKQQRQHTFARLPPTASFILAEGASLIQENTQFCCIDSQQRAASSPRFDWRSCLIQAQMSGPEHWLLTKTKINQAHSGCGCSVCLLVVVMWLVAWKIDLTASQSLCRYWDQRVCYKQIIDLMIDFSHSRWLLT